MKKNVLPKKLALSKLTLQELTVDQIAEAKGGAKVPLTSRRVDCSCA